MASCAALQNFKVAKLTPALELLSATKAGEPEGKWKSCIDGLDVCGKQQWPV